MSNRETSIEGAGSETLFRGIFEFAAMGIGISSHIGRLEKVNPAMTSILRYSAEKFASMHFAEFIHLQDMEYALEEITGLLDGKGESTILTLRCIRGDGEVIQARMTVSVMRNDAGEKIFMMLLQDVTEEFTGLMEVGRLARAVIRIQEDERSRMAHELHDDLGQSLFALKLQVQAALKAARENRETSEAERDIMENCNNIMGRTREISHNLSPVGLAGIGLRQSIKGLARTVAEPGRLRVHVELDCIDDFFEDGWDVNLYRIVQECLSNTLRHSGAEVVEISEEISDQQYRLCIRDDGKGMDLESRARNRAADDGIGLLRMRKRADILGGRLNMRSRPNQGMEVSIEIPLSNNSGG